MPIWRNPFGVVQVNINFELTIHYNISVDGGAKSLKVLAISELNRRISLAGLESMEESDQQDQGNWIAWWEMVTDGITWAEQARLRRAFGVLPWAENPFDYRVAWLDTNVMCFHPYAHPCEMWRVVSGLKELGMEPPEATAPLEIWQAWWQTASVSMPEKQRDLVWWLLMPFPYEIVEVPLEGER